MNGSKSGFRAPPRASAIGMWLFLAALGMLFLSSMLLYVLMRLRVFGRISDEPIHMPVLAWGSTAVLLAGSFSIHWAVSAIRLERLGVCLKYLYLTCGIAVLFLVIQSPCMARVLEAHRAIEAKTASGSPVSLYGLVFFLILVHALHVVGAIVALGIVTFNAHRRKYDHENYMGVQFAARYWHFLDVVWVGMFTMFLVMG
ncbi:MAG: cytochrome c oxidase subunit 3 [Tepidisphaeraceae bacterium]